MDILTLFVIVPLVTIIALMFAKDMKQARVMAMIGMGIQFIMSVNLVFAYLRERASGNAAEMIFTKSHLWFDKFNIYYEVGVDGISVAMILLTGIVTLAGVFISWEVEDLTKEFFISLIILAMGVFGFFISIDLFTMFLFYLRIN